MTDIDIECGRSSLLLLAVFAMGSGCGARSPLAFLQEDAGVPLDASALLGAQGVVLPPGTFRMGASDRDRCKLPLDPYERPVTLTRAFEIQTTEVTWGQVEAMLGELPEGGTCKDCPAMLSWYDANRYCNALSDQHGLPHCYTCWPALLTPWECDTRSDLATILDCRGFRLPTEAEWEYACRAGTDTPTYAGDWRDCHVYTESLAAIAWFAGNSGNHTHPVAGKLPNGWGLYDTLGNVWEMAYRSMPGAGVYSSETVDPLLDRPGIRRWVVRGGSYDLSPQLTRAAVRGPMRFLSSLGGFRVVRTVDD